MKKQNYMQIIELYREDDTGRLNKIKQAADILRNGGIVAFPTETVYGLGANALDETAVRKIYKAKDRPFDNPLIVHFANACEIEKYAVVTETARKIIDFFMPAPLTVVLKNKDIISGIITGGRDTVAVRVPKDKTARKLIELAGVPIAAPSANISGKPSATSAKHIIAELSGRVDAVLCGDDCEIGIESTVIAFDDNNGGKVRILRSGAITLEMLKEVTGEKNVLYGVNELKQGEIPMSPGMKYTHYSPNAPLYILIGDDALIIDFIKAKIYNNTQKIGFLCYNEIADKIKNLKDCENLKIISLGEKNNSDEQAKNLFHALNKFNETGVDIIYAAEPSRTGIGEAVYNRLEKAAGSKFINLYEER